MTRMLPAEVAQGTNKSERTIFSAIRDSEGSSDWCCLHSVGIARHKRKGYAECDFVLITELGVFCLEVKGGDVSRSDGLWRIGWPGKNYTSREGPFKQSQSAMQALIAELQLHKGHEFKRNVMFGWGVVFPDIEFHEKDPEWDLSVVYDRRDRSSPLREFILRLASYTREREATFGRRFPEAINHSTRQSILTCFRHDFALVPLLPDLLADSREELVRLSEDQYAVLKYALNPGNPRCLCPGSAGTGKTLVATEAARRLSAGKKKTLFLCFNRLLAQHLMKTSGIDPSFVTVTSLHKLMRAEIIAAGLEHDLIEILRGSTSDGTSFTRDIPQLFELALLGREGDPEIDQFNALIVDEGQDILHSPVIDALGCMLIGGWNDGNWIVFFDPDLQSDVYGRFDEKVLSSLAAQRAAVLPLDENFRNPERIVIEMARLTRITKPKCRRRLPVRMEYLTYSDADEEGKQLARLLDALIGAGVKPNEVCVLSPLRKEKSCVWRNRGQLRVTVTHFEKTIPASVAPGSVLAATISGFKGLEAEVVILTDMPESLDDSDAWKRAMWYVGMTRCKTKLVAIVSAEFSAQHLL